MLRHTRDFYAGDKKDKELSWAWTIVPWGFKTCAEKKEFRIFRTHHPWWSRVTRVLSRRLKSSATYVLHSNTNSTQLYTIFSRVTSTFILSVALCSLFWFTGALIYFGLSFSTDEFVGDRYFNFFLFGLIEIPATLLAYILGRYTTR